MARQWFRHKPAGTTIERLGETPTPAGASITALERRPNAKALEIKVTNQRSAPVTVKVEARAGTEYLVDTLTLAAKGDAGYGDVDTAEFLLP